MLRVLTSFAMSVSMTTRFGALFFLPSQSRAPEARHGYLADPPPHIAVSAGTELRAASHCALYEPRSTSPQAMPGSSTRHCVKASTGSSCAHARFLAAKLPPRAPKTHTRLRLGAMTTRSPGFSMSDAARGYGTAPRRRGTSCGDTATSQLGGYYARLTLVPFSQYCRYHIQGRERPCLRPINRMGRRRKWCRRQGTRPRPMHKSGTLHHCPRSR